MFGYHTATESEEENYIYSDSNKDNELPIKNPIKTFNRNFVSYGWSKVNNVILNDDVNSSNLLTTAKSNGIEIVNTSPCINVNESSLGSEACNKNFCVLKWGTQGYQNESTPLGLKNPTNMNNNNVLSNQYKCIKGCSWNYIVPYFFATCDITGETQIFDLRRKGVAMTFKTKNMVESQGIQWNPGNEKQLAVCYANTTAEIWDLKQPKSPQFYLENGHSKSVFDLSWSTLDSNILLTSGEDGIGCLWNGSNGELMKQINFQVSNVKIDWSPLIEGYISTLVSNSNDINIYNIKYTCNNDPESLYDDIKDTESINKDDNDDSSDDSDNNDISSDNKTLIELMEHIQRIGFKNYLDETIKHDIKIIEGSNISEGAREYADYRFQMYSLFEYLFSERGTCIEKIKQSLGYSKWNNIFKGNSKAACVTPFWDKTKKPELTKAEQEMVCQGTVKTAVLLKDFDTAVEYSIKLGNINDALVFGYYSENNNIGNDNNKNWQMSLEKYLETNETEFIRKYFKYIALNDFKNLVTKCDLNDWDDIVCILLSYINDRETLFQLLNTLGDRLRIGKEAMDALYCYSISGNIAHLMSLWYNIPLHEEFKLKDAISNVYIFMNSTYYLNNFSCYDDPKTPNNISILFSSYVYYIWKKVNKETAKKALMSGSKLLNININKNEKLKILHDKLLGYERLDTGLDDADVKNQEGLLDGDRLDGTDTERNNDWKEELKKYKQIAKAVQLQNGYLNTSKTIENFLREHGLCIVYKEIKKDGLSLNDYIALSGTNKNKISKNKDWNQNLKRITDHWDKQIHPNIIKSFRKKIEMERKKNYENISI